MSIETKKPNEDKLGILTSFCTPFIFDPAYLAFVVILCGFCRIVDTWKPSWLLNEIELSMREPEMIQTYSICMFDVATKKNQIALPPLFFIAW